MELIPRQLTEKLRHLATKFPIVTVTGPRQSGKSTIARMAFPDYKHVSLEDIDMREFALSDPRGFISTYPDKTIIDEVQRVPSLLSYLQTHTDFSNSEGMYILTGSQNSTLVEAIDQSLAGRTAIVTLLPLSEKELENDGLLPPTIDAQIFMGGYPRLFAKEISPTDYYPSYINTYIERDVRNMLQIGNLSKFVKLIKLCAGRIGQLLNKSSLAVEVGVSVPTIESWLSVLQASYIIYLLQPYYENISKRLVKTPKLFFYDTGLACSLLDITSANQVATHYLRGSLFENMVVDEIMKDYLNRGVRPSLWFWRDSIGNEIDLVDTTDNSFKLLEIKSGQTFNSDYFKGLNHWSEKVNPDIASKTVIYSGTQDLQTTSGQVLPWHSLLHSEK